MKKIYFALLAVLFLTLSINVNAKGYNYGIPKTTNNERPYPGKELNDLIKNNNGYYIAKDSNEIYFTFDCGYENGYTVSMLDTLKKHNVKAIFFITGHYLTSATDIVRRMIEDGHIIGNHGYKHKNFSKISISELEIEVTSLETKYEEIFGVKMSNFIRPPEGAISDESAKYLASKGYNLLFWSLAYVDWHKERFNGNHYAYNEVIKRIHKGAIILMHTVSKDNENDLDDILFELNALGFVLDDPRNITNNF